MIISTREAFLVKKPPIEGDVELATWADWTNYIHKHGDLSGWMWHNSKPLLGHGLSGEVKSVTSIIDKDLKYPYEIQFRFDGVTHQKRVSKEDVEIAKAIANASEQTLRS